ncbi:B12-binding domain-containing radical SAM protein [Methanosarcina vacuolata]|uniref:Fe-S oxidoreductase n=1 Tax=Methanosarcina vacuolata Z-761 TaxID=1434123 RepID=A0A0E3Q3L8_9EURY|nr:radical SAM protein [Methanosarcina vacuolata]AKB43080.1 Fe-S oxidoreductase [Methanosarcina vacuolata Z-761]
MRVYFLNPPFLPNFVRCGRWQGCSSRSGGLDYPKWLAYATAVVGQSFKDVKLVDAPAKKWDLNKVYEDVKLFHPDILVVDSNFSSLKNDIEITEYLKINVGIDTTIVVGPPVSQFPDEILNHEGVDLVARFEYDFTIKEIAEAILHGKTIEDIKGISYRRNGIIIHNPDRGYTTSKDLDSIPFVSKIYKEHLDIKDYFLSQSLYPEIQIFTGRGCPNRCSFCSWPVTLMGRKYRHRSSENIVDEFEYIKKDLPEVKEVFIEDDSFTIDEKLVLDVCNDLIKRKLNMVWSCNSRATLNYETMKLMKKAGCRLLIVGYESGSNEVLQTIKKGVNKERMIKFTHDAKKAGLLIHGDFIIGMPGEKVETAEQTLQFIKELKPNILQVAVATPLPGTEFYRYVKDNGYITVDDLGDSIDNNGFQRCIVSYPDFSKSDIEFFVDKTLKNYYLTPSFILVAVSNICRKNGLHELKSMFKSAKTFIKYVGRER